MFDSVQAATSEERISTTPIGSLTTVELAGLVARLASLNAEVADAERITQLDFLERLKGAAAAAQARVSVELDSSQREVQARQGMPAEQLGRGVADQVALARRDSKVKGSRHLGLAKALVREMPHTMAALTAGEISEWRATIVARETAVLSADDRRSVDACLGPDLATLGDAQLAARAKSIGYALDPTSALRRARGAIADRRVSIRPAPDTMAYVTGFLPVAQGVAVHVALRQAAASAQARGDQRSKAQIMADTFVERITGQATAEGVPLEVQLIMPAGTLLAGDDAPALIPGFGPVPAAFARDLVRGRAKAGEQDDGRDDAGAQGSGGPGSGGPGSGGPGSGGPGSGGLGSGGPGSGGPSSGGPSMGGQELAERASVWLRRLFTSPSDGSLVAMDSRRRTFDGLLRRFLVTRDQVCRTPWCDAPIRHIDHITAAADDGETTAVNGQGLCARCNYTKELPGWETELVPDPDRGRSSDGGRHRVRTTAPTGHTYESVAPPVLGNVADPLRARSAPDDRERAGPPREDHDETPASPLSTAFEELLRAA